MYGDDGGVWDSQCCLGAVAVAAPHTLYKRGSFCFGGAIDEIQVAIRPYSLQYTKSCSLNLQDTSRYSKFFKSSRNQGITAS